MRDKHSAIPVSMPMFDGNEKKYLIDCIDSSWVSSAGKYIPVFEKQLSDFCGVKYAVAVSNGTVALHLALATLGIGPGDEVLVPNLTFAATVNAVLYVGATPILVDVDPDTWNIDLNNCQSQITPLTKAIIPVHLFGHPCDMEEILDFANLHNLYIIEDCAEALGAEFQRKKVGSFGHISCFSFYGNKIITTGEGGICLTNDKNFYYRMKQLRDHGMKPNMRYWHELVGFNFRMTNMQAAIGCAQMEKIEQILDLRNRIEFCYDILFKNHPEITTQTKTINNKNICWLYSININTKHNQLDMEYIQNKLKESNIDSRPLFFPINEMPPYRKYSHDKLQVSHHISRSGLSLPTYPQLKNEDIEYICRELLKIVKSKDDR